MQPVIQLPVIISICLNFYRITGVIRLKINMHPTIAVIIRLSIHFLWQVHPPVLLRCHKILFPAYTSLPCTPAGIFDYWASNLTFVSQLPTYLIFYISSSPLPFLRIALSAFFCYNVDRLLIGGVWHDVSDE